MKYKLQYGMTLILVIVIMTTIFQFSSRNATASSHTSGRVTTWIVRTINEGLSLGWDEKTQKVWAERITYPVRKCAHFSEYALLAFCLEWHILSVMRLKENRNRAGLQKNKKIREQCFKPDVHSRIFWLAQLVASLYACSDELHQYFVPGRACRLFDVGVDSVGACAGIIVFLGIYKLCHLRRQ